MSVVLEMLQYPFMVRALVVGGPDFDLRFAFRNQSGPQKVLHDR